MLKHFTGLLAIILCLIISITGCYHRPEASTVPSEGMPSEVFVVSDEDLMDPLKTAFESQYNSVDSTLLVAEKADEKKYEKKYSFYFGRSQSFDGTEKTAPLILVFGESGSYSKDLTKRHPVESTSSGNGFSMQVFKNVWAAPQTVIRLRYGRDLTPEKILHGKGSDDISNLLYKYEVLQGLPGNLSANEYTDSVSRLIKNQYGFTFAFPPQFRLEFSNNEVIWLTQETRKFYRHLFINIFSDSMPMTLETAIENRDAFTRKYIKNEEHTHTLVSRSSLFQSRLEDFHAEAGDIKVLRGWYEEEGTFRRGPFARYYFHDVSNRRYVAIDGFLYAPDMKRAAFYRLFDEIAAKFRFVQ